MRNRLLLFILLGVLFVPLHFARISPKKSTKKSQNKTVLPKNSDKHISAKRKHLKQDEKLGHDVTGNTRQEISYNLDMVNNNGSSTLLYSKVLPKNSDKHISAKRKHLKQDEKLGHDVTGNTRQEISYNLDMVNNNGSSTLLYSKEGDVVNGGFTEWTAWTNCSNDCKKTSLRSRERYCTDPAPSNGGVDCDGERFQLQLCKRVPCRKPITASLNREDGNHRSIDSDELGESTASDVSWRFGEWSGWDKCHCNYRHQRRYRKCYSHGGVECTGDTVETKSCQPKGCKETGKESLVNIDPTEFCGFNPCDISKCLVAPLGSCVSDYKCRPVFFDEKSKQVDECFGNRIYIDPEKVFHICKINPCDYTRCLLDFSEKRCVVGTRCQAIYYNPQGKPQKCTAVLKVPAEHVCGYNPCSAESCQQSPNARCLVTSKCQPIYVNSFNERIKKCEKSWGHGNEKDSEDEFEAEPDDDYEDEDDQDEEDNDNRDDEDVEDEHSTDKDNIYDNEHEDGTFTTNNENIDNFKNIERDEQDDTEDDEDNDDDDNDDVDHYGNDNFQERLAIHQDKHHRFQDQDIKSTKKNHSQNSSRPLLAKLLNVESGHRRTQKYKQSSSSNINTASLSLSDIIHGKLNSSQNVVSGTMKKSMKIISSKKPTKFFYFETKEGTGNKTRQFMVITAPKTKKSSVISDKKPSL